MWKFKDFSATQILREINLVNFEAQKTQLPFWPFLDDMFDIFKCEIPKKSKFIASKIGRMTVFDPLKSAKIDLT